MNERPRAFESYLSGWGSLEDFRTGDPLEWLSPRSEGGYRELRDGLWSRAQLPAPSPQQDGFWPRRGPQWDGVALVGGTDERGVLLVEAKSHIGELRSSPSGSEGARLAQIRAALDDVKEHLDVPRETEWAKRYYQLTNRLAYLFYLRERLQYNAWLLWVYFLGDDLGVPGGRVCPSTKEEWRSPIDDAKVALKLPSPHALSDFTFEAFVPAAPGPDVL